MLPVSLIYTEDKLKKNSISATLNISFRKPRSFKINNERVRKNTMLYLDPKQRQSLCFLFPYSWFQSQQNSSIKLPPICSLLLKLLASLKQEPGRVADKRTAALGTKIKPSQPHPKEQMSLPRTTPSWPTLGWSALPSRLTSGVLKPLPWVSNLLASLSHTGRRVGLGHTLNTHTLTKTDEQKKRF